MRKFIYISIFSLLIVGNHVSCKKFLETKPEDFASSETYFNTEDDLNRALNGVYNRLVDNLGRMYASGLFSYFVVSDEFFFKGTTSMVNNVRVMDINANNLDIGRLWEVMYSAIDRVNLLLENVDKPEMDERRREVIRGEALFLRGYFYFLLADLYGGVPLKLHSTQSASEPNLPGAPIAEIYAQITKDMKEAEGLVSDISEYTYNERVTKTVVQAILARVYLTMAGSPLKDVARYEDALIYADKVISSGAHALNPSYSQIFINHTQDKYDVKECLWEIGMSGYKIDGTAELAGFVGVINGVICPDETIGYSGGSILITKKLYDMYEPDDKRRDWSIAPYKYVKSGTSTARQFFTGAQIYDRTPGKWRREYEPYSPKGRNYSPTNFPVIRYADVLLMKAEAENYVNGGPTSAAYNAMNQVRRRGFEKPIDTPDPLVDLPAGLGQQDFFEEIKKERMRELCFEGIRKHDLIRWGTYIETMNALGADINATAPSNMKYAAKAGLNMTARNVLFPIPSTEMAANLNISQNKGF